jgi:hypothetical protein
VISTPYLAGAAAIAIMASGIGGFFFGRDTGKDAVRAEIQGKWEDALRDKGKAEAELARLTGIHSVLEQKRQTAVREIRHETTRVIQGDPVYRNRCVNGDGLQLLDRAVAAANGEAAGAPPGATTGVSRDEAVDGSGDGTGGR